MSNSNQFIKVLAELNVNAGDLIFLHTSFKRLAYLNLTPQQIIEHLVERIGSTGTLVMPSYAWNIDRTARPWKSYSDYYRERTPFDVATTPSTMGFITEVFRRTPGVKRSVSSWYSI